MQIIMSLISFIAAMLMVYFIKPLRKVAAADPGVPTDGRNFLVSIATTTTTLDGVTAVTYTPFGCQKNATFGVDTDTIDTTNKQSGQFKTNIPGRSSCKLDFDALTILPDVAADLIRSDSLAGTAVSLQYNRPDGSSYAISGTISSWSEDSTDADAATFKCSVECSGTPVYTAKK